MPLRLGLVRIGAAASLEAERQEIPRVLAVNWVVALVETAFEHTETRCSEAPMHEASNDVDRVETRRYTYAKLAE